LKTFGAAPWADNRHRWLIRWLPKMERWGTCCCRVRFPDHRTDSCPANCSSCCPTIRKYLWRPLRPSVL